MIIGINYHHDLPSSIRNRICGCSDWLFGPYPQYDVKVEVCSVCFKPRSERAYQCVECGDYFVQHGDTKFKHPQFCPLSPMCWACCESTNHGIKECCEFCANSLREIPIHRTTIRQPPKRLPIKLDAPFDLFAR